MPHGIAHWNGLKWHWVARIDQGLIQEIVPTETGIAALDADGTVSFFSSSGPIVKWPGPSGLSNAHPHAATAAPSFFSLSSMNHSKWAIVGDYGLIYLTDGSVWKRVMVDSTGRFVQIIRTGLEWLVAGYSGLLFSFDGSACIQWPISPASDVLSIEACGEDTAIALVKSDNIFSLQVLRHYESVHLTSLPQEVLAVGAFDLNHVVYTTYNGIYLWSDGAIRFLFEDETAGQIQKIQNRIAVATHPQSEAAIWFGYPNNAESLRISLDKRFLQ
jgi:hypothetical protein